MFAIENEDTQPSKCSKRNSGRGLGRGRARGRGRGVGRRTGADRDGSDLARPSSALDAEWKSDDAVPQRHPFTGDPGVKASVTDWTDVCSIFQLFFTEAFLNSIVDETISFLPGLCTSS